jgi:DnaJ-class molecular chaperone
MSHQVNYYEVLGVREDASQDEIKKAYRRLAKEYHPDSRDGERAAEEQFKKISEAYSILSDKQRRQQYDLLRQGSFMGSDGFNFHDSGTGSYRVQFGEDLGDIGDIFNSFFAGFGKGSDHRQDFFSKNMNVEGFSRPGTPTQSRGADMESTITIPFEMAMNGGETIIKTGGGKRVKIKIPAGTEDGKKIRLRGHGAPSDSGRNPGHLYLNIKVTPHPEFERVDNDIHSHLYVNIAEAVLGTEVQVKTVRGKKVKLKIPAGTSSAKVFRLPGMGIKKPTGYGDHYVRIEIDVPPTLSLSQKREFRTWAKKLGLIN